jgi:glutathionyl-hydroquinone reductase
VYESDLRMMREHLQSLERVLNALAWLYNTGQAQHITEADLRTLEQVIEHLMAEIDTQEEQGDWSPRR